MQFEGARLRVEMSRSDGGGGGRGGGGGGGGGGQGAAVNLLGPGGFASGSRGGGYPSDGYSVGGDGGRGRAGGEGGYGGSGGYGGAGGGAFQIVAQGMIHTIQSTFFAKGGHGSKGGAGDSGDPGSNGDDGTVDTGRWTNSGNGGNGGLVGTGGKGGKGGTGGVGGTGSFGGGGAGGTVKLVASNLSLGTSAIDTRGGNGATSTYNGGNGRWIVGSNVPTSTAVSLTGTRQESFTGTRSANAFLANVPLTPNIIDLYGGAEAFGLLGEYDAITGLQKPLDARSVFSDEVLKPLSASNATAALLRVGVGPVGYSDDYVGYDMILMVNLTNRDLVAPHLGVGNVMQPLLQGGWQNDATYGGAGDQLLTKLNAYQIYATLVPSSETRFQFGGTPNASGANIQVEQGTLTNNQVMYLTPDASPNLVYQKLAPTGPTLGATTWQSVQQITVDESTGSTVRVEVINNGQGTVVADAVRLSRPVLAKLSVVDLRDNPLDSRAFDTIIPAMERPRNWTQPVKVTYGAVKDFSATTTLIEGILTTANESPILGTDPGPQSLAAGQTVSIPLSPLATDTQTLRYTVTSDTPQITGSIVGSDLRISSANGFTGFGTITVTVSDAVTTTSALDGRTLQIRIPVSVGQTNYSGKVFIDTTRNLQLDEGEQGLEGRVVYIDANADGVRNPGERSTVTDANGQYLFQGMPSGADSIIALQRSSDFLVPSSQGRAVVGLRKSAPWQSAPDWVVNFNNAAYMSVTGADGTGRELWKFDGKKFSPVADLNPTGDGLPYSWQTSKGVVFDGKLYFAGTDGSSTGIELYSYDGTTMALVGDFNSSGDFLPDHLTAFQNKLYMSGDTGDGNGRELYRLDGTNVVRVTDIGPGSSDALYNWNEVVVAGTNLYFTSSQNTLVKFDGTTATTLPITDYIYNLTNYGGVLHFVMYSPATGSELFRLFNDQPQLASDIDPGTNSSNPGDFVESNGKLVFTAQTAADGRELREFDGTTTRLIDEGLASGSASGSPTILGDSPQGVYYWAQPDGSPKPGLYLYGNKVSDFFFGTDYNLRLFIPQETFSNEPSGIVLGDRFHVMTEYGSIKIVPVPLGERLRTNAAGTQDLGINFDQIRVVDAGPAVSVLEGRRGSFVGTVISPDGTTAGWTSQWSALSGTTVLASSTRTAFSGIAFSTRYNFTPTDDGWYTVKLVLRKGALTYSSSTSLQGKVVAPAFTLPSTIAAKEGQSLTQTVAFTDSGADAWRANVSYGDGTPDQIFNITGANRSFTFTHTYRDDGSYPLSIEISDLHDRVAVTRKSTVQVAKQTRMEGPSAPVTIAEGTLFTRVLTFLDGLDAWKITVNYGDGSPPIAVLSTPDPANPSRRRISLSHRYADNGRFNLVVSVRDTEDGTPASTLTIPVTVTNSRPTISGAIKSVGVLKEANPISFSFVGSDVEADKASLIYQWDYSYNGTTFVVEGTGSTVSHSYPDNGTFIIAARLKDKDGAVSALLRRTLTIANVAPQVNLGSDESVIEGKSLAFNANSFATDAAGAMDLLTYQWALKNSAGTVIRSANTAVFNPVIPNNGSYTLSLTARDGDGGVTTDTRVIRGINAAPLVKITAPAQINEGSTAAIDAVFSDPGTDAPWEYRWEVVSDNGQVVSPVTGNLTKTGAVPRFSLTGLEEGSYFVKLSVSDGVTTTVTNKTVLVNNVAPRQIVIDPISGVKAGAPFTAAGTFVDPGADSWTGDISFGSGLNFPLEISAHRFIVRNILLPWPGTYVAKVTLRDADGGVAVREVQVAVSHINSRPVLNIVPAPALTSVIRNSNSHAGDSVGQLLGTAFRDTDAGSLKGIAVVSTDARNGVWQFSLDNGETWTEIRTSSAASSRLLSAESRLRFLPNSGYFGSASLQYRAWDRSAGTIGGVVDLSRTGALGANSPAGAEVETAVVKVLAPPMLSLGGTVTTSLNTASVKLAASGDVRDDDSTEFRMGRLTVTIRNNGTLFDRLTITHQGTATGQIGLNGSSVLFGGLKIGTFSGGSGLAPLVIQFSTSAADKPAIRALLRSLTFQCVSSTASKAQRQIDFMLVDNTGVASQLTTKLLNIL